MEVKKKLFRVLFSHTSPKDQKLGIEEYVVANSDAYYGITLYGWEFVKDLTDIEFQVLTNIGIAKCL